MHHLDLFSLVSGETIEVLQNDRSLATAHLGSFLPKISSSLCGWMSLKCTLVAPPWVLLPLQQCGSCKWQIHPIPAARDTGSLLGGTASHLHRGASGASTSIAWSSTHVACESMSMVKVILPESPCPPSHSCQSLLSHLWDQARGKEDRRQTELSTALSRLKGTIPSLSDIHVVEDVGQSCKQASRSGKNVETPK